MRTYIKYNYLIILLIIVIITIYYYNNENFKCKKSTIDNPFKNYLLYNTDEIDDKNCNIKDNKERYNYELNLYKNLDDLYDMDNSYRHFYTMPITNTINNIEEYGNWLYKKEGSCKIDGLNCLNFVDLRYQ